MTDVLYSARVEVRVDGARLPEVALSAVTEVRVVAELGLPRQAQVVFRDPPRELWSTGAIERGASLWLGTGVDATPVFEGDVTCIEHEVGPGVSRRLVVRGYDRLFRLRRQQRLEVYADVTAEDLARRLAGAHGLAVSAEHEGPVWRSLAHDGRDDLALLRDVAGRAGLYPSVEGDRLRLLTLAGFGDPVPLRVGDNLRRARVEDNDARAVGAVEAFGWNPRATQTPQGRAIEPWSGRETEAPAPREGTLHLARAGVESDAHAEHLAAAELSRRAAGALVLSGVADGDPVLGPGRRVRVEGVAPQVDGVHVLTRVEHVFDTQAGFRTELGSEPPARPPRRGGLEVAEADVTQVADPAAQGRVRVRVRGYAGIETDWLRVLSAGAGAGKGLVATPGIGDRVLVLLADGDPARGVVLGGLFDDAGPQDAGVDGDQVARFSLRTPSGHRIVFDEGGEALRIENADGSWLALSREQVDLHSARDLVIEAPGRNLTLRAKRIDFEQA